MRLQSRNRVLQKLMPFIPSLASFLAGVGVEVSGIEIPILGYALIVLSFTLLLIPAWHYKPSITIRSPIVFREAKGPEDDSLPAETHLPADTQPDDYDQLRRRQTESPRDFITLQPTQLVVDSKESGALLTLRYLVRSCLLKSVFVEDVKGQIEMPFPGKPRKSQSISFELRHNEVHRVPSLLEETTGGIREITLDSRTPVTEIAKQLVALDYHEYEIRSLIFISITGVPKFQLDKKALVEIIDNNKYKAGEITNETIETQDP